MFAFVFKSLHSGFIRNDDQDADLNASSIFGRTLPGYVADRVGRYNTMIFMVFLSTILIFAFWIPSTTNAPLIVFSALYGFSSGAFVSLGPALIAQISEIHQIGARTGTSYIVSSIAVLTGSPIGGALIPNDPKGRGFWKLQVFGGVVMLAGSILFVAARIYIGGLNPRKKV
jgi:MFS family permease